MQQQTTWNEIPEKPNSSSSLTKNTLCSFIKFLRAPNPKPGVLRSLNNQVGTYIEARMMQHCSSFSYSAKWSEEEEEATWTEIRKNSLQNKLGRNSILAPQILLFFLTDSHARLLKPGASATLTSKNFWWTSTIAEKQGKGQRLVKFRSLLLVLQELAAPGNNQLTISEKDLSVASMMTKKFF